MADAESNGLSTPASSVLGRRPRLDGRLVMYGESRGLGGGGAPSKTCSAPWFDPVVFSAPRRHRQTDDKRSCGLGGNCGYQTRLGKEGKRSQSPGDLEGVWPKRPWM